MPNRREQLSFSNQLKGFALAQTLRGLSGTLDFKIAHYDQSSDPAHPSFGEPCIWVFWHEYILTPITMWGGCDVTMLVSQHRDANWLMLAAYRMGFKTVRGSTTRGGTEAIRQLKKLTNSSGIVITPDGPRGPRRQMALGPIYLASRLGMPIVATGFGNQHPWRLNTWDNFAIPKPFSRTRIIMGPKIHLPRKLDRDGLEAARVDLEHMMHTLSQSAEQWAEQGGRLSGELPFLRRPNRNWRNNNATHLQSIKTGRSSRLPRIHDQRAA